MTISTSIEVPDDAPCAFCGYLDGSRPYTVLKREPLVAALVTREQRGASHVLVVTARHTPTLLDLTDDEAGAVMDLLRRVAAAIDLAAGRPGISVWQNNGTPAGQAIGHFHFHVAGTNADGGTNFGQVPELPLAQTEAIATRLRLALPTL